MRRKLFSILVSVALLLCGVPARAATTDIRVSYFGNQVDVFNGILSQKFAGTGQAYLFSIQPQNSISFYLSNSGASDVTLEYQMFTCGSPTTPDYSNNKGLWQQAPSYSIQEGYVPSGSLQQITVTAGGIVYIQSPVSSASQVALVLSGATINTAPMKLSAVFTPQGSIPQGTSAFAQFRPTQNSHNTSAPNGSLTITLTPTASQAIYLYSLAAYCSGGSAGVTVEMGGTDFWDTPSTFVGTGLVTANWTTPLSGIIGQPLTVILSSCGPGNNGTLSLQESIQ